VATESDLRDLLRGPEPEGSTTIDLDSVLRRTRARRRPRVVAASTLGAFALAGVLTPVVLFSLPSAQPSTLISAEDADGSPVAPESGDTAFTALPAAATLNACAAPVADIPSGGGLVLEIAPLSAGAGEERIPVAVTLRNDGTDRVVGVTGNAPVVTLAGEGIVLWHSHRASDLVGVTVDLDPGESMSYSAEFDAVTCGPQDDADGFREDLPPVAPGSYALTAALDFYPDDGTGAAVLVTGPPAAVELRDD
jgi:hypothetical protein